MKIVVLGAGVIGTAAAYYLARDGHEVVVLERHAEAAEGTSYGNGGFVSPSDATAWASPAALKTFFRSLANPDLGIRVRFSLDPHYLSWVCRFLRECTTARMHANTDIKLRLALYSLRCINEITDHTGIAYDQRSRGLLYICRSQADLDANAAHMRYLADRGVPIEVADRNRVAEIEPALAAAKERFAGAVYSPMDQTGDSRIFTQGLARWSAEHLGASFRYSTDVTGLDIEGGRVSAVVTSGGPLPCDAAVLSMGPESGLFARKYGLDLPIYPVKGYIATLPLDDPSRAPTTGGVDEGRYVSYARLGDRLRLSSSAEFAGFDRSHRAADFARMFRSAHDLFPGLIDESRADCRAGLRPMMPNSVPAIGRTRYANLYLDTGHGHLGWTLACGSGRLLADIVAGRKPEIDTAGLLYPA
jgi:D-amino-acid dehydrogenase